MKASDLIGRSVKIFLEVLGTLVVLAGIAVAVLAWRLSEGPVSLAFLTPVIEEAINVGDTPTRIELEDAVLSWGGWKRTLDVRAVGVTVRGADGARLAQVPEVSFNLSARALLRGMVAPTRLEITGAKITLTRAPDGHLELPRGEGDDNSASVLPLLLHDLANPLDRNRSTGYLREVSVTDAEVTLTDLSTGRVWRAPEAAFEIFRDGAGLRAQAALAVDAAGELARLTVTGRYSAEQQQIELTAATNAFQPAALAAIDPRLGGIAALKTPISGTTHLWLDAAGRLLDLDFDLVGAGGVLSKPEYFPEDVPIKGLRVRGSMPQGLDRIDIAEASLDLNGPTVEMSGSIADLRTAPQIRIEGVARGVATNDLRHLWPQGVGTNPRRWVTTNLSGGTVEETRFRIGLAADASFSSIEANDVQVQLRFSGVDVNYLSPMPPVRKVSGTGTLNLQRLDLAINGGNLGNLHVAESKIAITSLDAKDQDADIEVVVRGPVREALQLVDGPPLGYIKRIGFTPADFGGDAAVRLRLRFPLLNDLKIEQVQIAAAANIANYTQRKAALGQDISDGTLALRLDQRGMDISGRVVLAGIPAEIQLARSFVSGTPAVGQVKAKATLDTDARRRLGLDLAPYVDGPVRMDLTMTEQRGRRSDLVIEAGLADATLEVPELGWHKAAGAPGTAQIRLALVDQRLTELGLFRVAAPDLAAQGRGAFAEDGSTLRRLDFDHLKTGLTDARGSYIRSADGIAIEVTGSSLDMGPLLRDKSPSAPERPRLRVSADLDRVYFAPDRYMDRVDLKGVRGLSRWESLSLKAMVGTQATARNLGISLRNEGGLQRLDASAEDAGAVLKALDVTPNVVGGKLEVSGASQPEVAGNPLVGKVHMRNFRVVNAPVLARVLSVALLTGIVDALRGEGIQFNRLDANFALREPAVEIKDARASGASIGITAGGTVDLGADAIDLDGTIVPAYAVNSLLGKIPVVGDILVGGKGGGLFAANYKITGAVSDPKVTINPLSTLAPGFLRNLFGILENGTSPTGTEPRPEPGAPANPQ